LILMVPLFRRWLTQVGLSTAHPAAFCIIGVYIALWLIFSPGTFRWAGVATIATWIMTLFIRRAENRDSLAIQAKLDELLRAEHRARSELTTLDQKEPEEIARHRARQRRSTSTG
jgi:low affinity Fe/Cu permease